MATFIFRNNSKTSSIPVAVTTTTGSVRRYNLSPSEIFEMDGVSLTPETSSVIAKKYVTLLSTTTTVAEEASVSEGLPMVWTGEWSSGIYYNKGCVVSYLGQNYVAILTHKSQQNPADDTTNFATLSVESPETFFGINPASWNANELLVKTPSGWEAKKITDVNIGTVTIDAITGLRGELDSKIGEGDSVASFQVTTSASSPNDVTNKTYVDTKLPKAGGAMTGPITGDHGLLPLAGGTLTGSVSSAINPTTVDHLTRKGYITANFVPKSGGVVTGQISSTPASTPTAVEHLVNKGYADDKSNDWLGGGTMTGPLILSGNPSNVLGASPKQYVDAGLATKLSSSGGDVSGDIDVSGILSVDGSPVVTEATLDLGNFTSPVNFSSTARFTDDAYFDHLSATSIGATLIEVDTLEAVDATVTGTFAFTGTDFSMGGGVIEGLGNASTSGDAVSRGYGDARYLKLAGGNRMEVDLLLDTAPTVGGGGLKEDFYTGSALWKDSKVVTRSTVKRITVDYEVEDTVGVVLVDTGLSMVTVYIPSTLSNQSEITVKKIGGMGPCVVVVRDQRDQAAVQTIIGAYVNDFATEMVTLTDVGSSATFSPNTEVGVISGDPVNGSSWVLSAFTSGDGDGNISVHFSLSGSITSSTQTGITTSVTGSSKMRVPVSSTTHYKVGDVVNLSASGYNTYSRVELVSSSGSYIELDTTGSILSSAVIAYNYADVLVNVYDTTLENIGVNSIEAASTSTRFNISPSVSGISAYSNARLRGHDGYNSVGMITAVNTGYIETDILFSSTSLSDTVIEVVRRQTPTLSTVVGLSISSDLDNPVSPIHYFDISSGTNGNTDILVDVPSTVGFTSSEQVNVFGDYSGVYSISSVVGNSLVLPPPFTGSGVGFVQKGTGNITSTRGNSITKSAQNSHLTLQTYQGSGTLRVSGWEPIAIKPFSVFKKVVPIEGWNGFNGSVSKVALSVTATALNASYLVLKIPLMKDYDGSSICSMFHVGDKISWSALSGVGSASAQTDSVIQTITEDATYTIIKTSFVGGSAGSISSGGITNLKTSGGAQVNMLNLKSKAWMVPNTLLKVTTYDTLGVFDTMSFFTRVRNNSVVKPSGITATYVTFEKEPVSLAGTVSCRVTVEGFVCDL